MKKIACFGELLLRLSPDLNGEWIHDSSMPSYVGGAELNVGKALAMWQQPIKYITILPENNLSLDIIQYLSRQHIDVSNISYADGRIGIYYLPQGSDLKYAGVIYDREYSSFAKLKTGQIDWDKVLDDVNWFHFSAISPALNQNVADVCMEALEAATKKGINISVDLNYRAKLWKYGKLPGEVMPQLVSYCNVIMGNVWAEETMLNLQMPLLNKASNADYINASHQISEAIMENYPKCEQVANTFRFDHNKGITYFATLYSDQKLFTSQHFHTNNVVDKVGSGDAFMAALIFGTIHQLKEQERIDLAAASAFTKLFIKGDHTTATLEDIKKHLNRYA
jgi:2-dehydro-3-deoxygluconokinase